jgi:hypothetical protein
MFCNYHVIWSLREVSNLMSILPGPIYIVSNPDNKLYHCVMDSFTSQNLPGLCTGWSSSCSEHCLGNAGFNFCWPGTHCTSLHLDFSLKQYIWELFWCHLLLFHILWAKQVERDPEPLYRAAKELINMQLQSGEFPQQVSLQFFGLHNHIIINAVLWLIVVSLFSEGVHDEFIFIFRSMFSTRQHIVHHDKFCSPFLSKWREYIVPSSSRSCITV